MIKSRSYIAPKVPQLVRQKENGNVSGLQGYYTCVVVGLEHLLFCRSNALLHLRYLPLRALRAIAHPKTEIQKEGSAPR